MGDAGKIKRSLDLVQVTEDGGLSGLQSLVLGWFLSRPLRVKLPGTGGPTDKKEDLLKVTIFIGTVGSTGYFSSTEAPASSN